MVKKAQKAIVNDVVNCITIDWETLKTYEANALKEADNRDVTKLKNAIVNHGFKFPFFVWADKRYVIDGAGRIAALLQLEAEGYKIPALPVVEIAAETLHDAKIAVLHASSQHGKITEASWSEFTDGLDITALLDEISFTDIDLEQKYKIKKLAPQAEPDDVPSIPLEARTKRGGLWILGQHKLLCGDSSKLDDVSWLMNGDEAHLWLTDPPYGVSYQSNGAEDKHRKIENDSHSMDVMQEFWSKVAQNTYTATRKDAPYYWCACQGGDQMMMMMMSLGSAKWNVRHELIWVKDSLVLGRCDYHYKHEPILYGWKRDGKHNWYGDRKQTSVLEFPRPKSSDLHPTMKPVDLFAYLINNSTAPGDIVLDTFGGSGTTIIACEQTGRQARVMEIDPLYCDVIIKRWEHFTGQTAVLYEEEAELQAAS